MTFVGGNALGRALLVLFNFVRCPCSVFDIHYSVTFISTLLLTYLLAVRGTEHQSE